MRSRAKLRGYVLAGGQSTRMGTDKADVVFEGMTMLERAVATMSEVCDVVSVVGARDLVPAEATCIPDVYPRCGPMGGIQAALQDCRQNSAEFAVFLPVDMPLLPGGFLRALTEFWMSAETVRVAVTVADGRIQPLVSMLHVDISATLVAALTRGDHKLQPALRAAAAALAEQLTIPAELVFLETAPAFGDRVVLTADGVELPWSPTPAEWERRSLWFTNLNTQRDLQEALEQTRTAT